MLDIIGRPTFFLKSLLVKLRVKSSQGKQKDGCMSINVFNPL
jgi:hypothetical protein